LEPRLSGTETHRLTGCCCELRARGESSSEQCRAACEPNMEQSRLRVIYIKTHMSLTFSPLDTPKMLAVEHHRNEWPGCRAREEDAASGCWDASTQRATSQQTSAQTREEAAASEAACDSRSPRSLDIWSLVHCAQMVIGSLRSLGIGSLRSLGLTIGQRVSDD